MRRHAVRLTRPGIASRRLHTLTVDNAQGVKSALRHLLRYGHQRVAFLSHKPDTLDMVERVAAFRRGIGTLGLDVPDELLICRDDPAGTRAVVDAAIRKWFSGRRPPTAILSGCHMVTSFLVEVLAEAGIRCPNDVSIVGFDDSPLLSHLATPITVVRQPLVAMGERAAQIYRTLAAEKSPQPVRVILPVELVVRDSCAPPRPSPVPSRAPTAA
jgi:LacI family transcriptional regulator